jgi:uncharacterized protein (DUF2235 family)
MSKNIVVCCDGTDNQFGTRNTNVVHMFSTLVQDPGTQVAYYHPGLGTMGAAGAWTRMAQWYSKLLGLAIGRGLSDDIRDAYVFVMQQYEAGDKLFLFGFSRGAYTVRALTGLLHMFGLIRRGNEPLVPYAIQLLTNLEDQTFEVAAKFKLAFSRRCQPHFVGVWDTVSSVGWFWDPLTIPYSADDPDIAVGRHAIAIDERRAFFRPNLWRPAGAPPAHGPRDLKQVWFPGVHSDVGGGYPEAESGLSKVALHWMLREAQDQGLKVDETKVNEVLGVDNSVGEVPPDCKAPIHDSLGPWWWWAEFIPKKHHDWQTQQTNYRMNLFRRRMIPENSLIHRSAFARGPDYPKNKPRVYTEVD